MVKLSCAGSIGLSFIGTRRATQIRHDCRSTGVRVGGGGGGGEGRGGGEKRNRVEGNESGGCNKEDGDREGGGGMNDGVRGRGKK